MSTQLKHLLVLLLTGIMLCGGQLRAASRVVAGNAAEDDAVLRVLCIGNSYSLDATRYLERMMQQAGFGSDQYGFCCVVHAGASLQYWSEHLASDKVIEEKYTMAGTQVPEGDGWTLRQLLREPWDIVVLQQSSNQSDDYATYTPYVDSLVQAVRRECPNPRVRLAWHMTWSHALSFWIKPYSRKGWSDIASATEQLLLQPGRFDLLIPSGTAIQNGRACMDDDLELTRDGSHIVYGVGHYLLALTWYEALVAPYYGVSLLLTPPSADICSAYSDMHPFWPVTELNWQLCQECVKSALALPYEVYSTGLVCRLNTRLHRLRPTEERLYDLAGRRLSRPIQSGIYICGKQKCCVR